MEERLAEQGGCCRQDAEARGILTGESVIQYSHYKKVNTHLSLFAGSGDHEMKEVFSPSFSGHIRHAQNNRGSVDDGSTRSSN